MQSIPHRIGIKPRTILLTVTEYVTNDHICVLFVNNHNPFLSSLVTYKRVCNKSNTNSTTCGTDTAYAFIVFSGVRVAV
jgi:hypothetical protein